MGGGLWSTANSADSRRRLTDTVEGVLPALGAHYTAIGTAGGEALHIGDLFDVRLDELRAVREATLPVALER